MKGQDMSLTNITKAEQDLIDGQGWNTDSLNAVLASWDPAKSTRLQHMINIAAEENSDEDEPDSFTTRTIVVTVTWPDGAGYPDADHCTAKVADNISYWLSADGAEDDTPHSTEVEVRDARDVIDPEFAQEWQDAADEQGFDPHDGGYPVGKPRVEWSTDTRTCTITSGGNTVTFTMDSDLPTVHVNDRFEGTLSLDDSKEA